MVWPIILYIQEMCNLMQTAIREVPLARRTIPLVVSEDELFLPNTVTNLFSKKVIINPGDVVFDIGSGVGPLAIWAAKEPSSQVYAVEIVDRQYELLNENIMSNGVADKVVAYRGRFFEPIPSGVKADVIIADVSGIAELPARAFGWYPPEIPTGGEDGTGVIIPVLEQAGAYLKEGGRLYFPVATSLSDGEKIMDVARRHFGKLEAVLDSQLFPLTAEQIGRLREMEKTYGECPHVRLETKGSRTIWKGSIYRAEDPLV
jgi:SAM-dependent methyltransferase